MTAYIIYIAIKQVLAYLGYLGNDSSEHHAELLQFFSREQVDAGIE